MLFLHHVSSGSVEWLGNGQWWHWIHVFVQVRNESVRWLCTHEHSHTRTSQYKLQDLIEASAEFCNRSVWTRRRRSAWLKTSVVVCLCWMLFMCHFNILLTCLRCSSNYFIVTHAHTHTLVYTHSIPFCQICVKVKWEVLTSAPWRSCVKMKEMLHVCIFVG